MTAPAATRDAVRAGYLRAAAVLAWFDPERLQPDGPPTPGGALAAIGVDSRPVPLAGHAGAWRLRSEARREGLRLLGTREAMSRALERNEPFADPDDNFQRLLAAYIRGNAPPLSEQSAEELGCTLQAVLWLRHALTDELPAADEVRRRRDERLLFEPFEELVGDGFAGREDELARLREHVGVLPAGLLNANLGRTLDRVVGRDPPPLSVYGAGGVGKSTLLAKFILEHGSLDAPARVPFVVIDFEDAALDPYDWRGWVELAGDQLAVQARCHTEPAMVEGAREELTAALEAERGRGRAREPAAVAARVATLARLAASRDPLSESIWGAEIPFLVVIDSLEELQYYGARPALSLARVLTAITRAYPGLRVVLVGRAPSYVRAAGRKPRHLELEAFDAPAAVAYLRRVGVKDPELAETVFREVGGQPLSLRLAARVVIEERLDDRGVRKLGARRLGGLLRARDAAIQGQLYGRILGHLKDPEVEVLAEPGFVVRRLTADVIAHVLQPATGREPDLDTAHRLMELLRRERSLVVGRDAAVVRYRPQVRQEMLAMLQARSPQRVRAVDEAAFAYFRAQDDVADRAEAVYHGLRLGGALDEIDALWSAGLERYLANVDPQELAPAERAFLNARLGRDVDEPARHEARFDDWERQAVAAAREMLDAEEWLAALERLSERSERPAGSPLWALQARALIGLERYETADAVIASGLEQAAEPRFADQALELHVLAVEVAERRQDLAVAREHLDAAIAITPSRLKRLRLELKRLQLGTDRVEETHNELARDFVAATDQELAGDVPLVRELARELGPERPDVLARAVELAPVSGLTPERRDRLADVLGTSSIEPVASRDEGLLGSAARNFDVELNESTSEGWREILGVAESHGGLNDILKRLLSVAWDSRVIRTVIAAAVAEAERRDAYR